MSEPIVFISHFRVKPGKAEAYKQLQRDIAEQLAAEKPRTLVFRAYVTENGTQMTAVHVFADAQSMDLHFEGSGERSKAAYEFLQPDGWEIYGRPSRNVIDSMSQAAAASGVALTLHREYVAGFLRPTAS